MDIGQQIKTYFQSTKFIHHKMSIYQYLLMFITINESNVCGHFEADLLTKKIFLSDK